MNTAFHIALNSVESKTLIERGGSNERIVGPQGCQFKYCYELPT